MNALNLSVLPAMKNDDATVGTLSRSDGFVDDAVVFKILAGPAQPRQSPVPAELALAADDMDFAGWSLSEKLPSSSTQALAPTTEKRPAPPILEEPGIGEPHRGSHRWWMAGLAGAFSTILFSLLLFSLSSSIQPPVDEILILQVPADFPAPIHPGADKPALQLTSTTPLD